MTKIQTSICTAVAAALVSGCVSGPAPDNYATARWAPGQIDTSDHHPEGDWVDERRRHEQVCEVEDYPVASEHPLWDRVGRDSLQLASGDRLHIEILGDVDTMSGLHVIGNDGRIELDGDLTIYAANLSVEEFQEQLRDLLIHRGYVRPLRNAVRVKIAEASSVQVFVSGAVFEPGAVRAGIRRPETRIGQKEGEASGDANYWRTLSSALRAAGGVRPDANLSGILLIRDGRSWRIDLSGLPLGLPFSDPNLAPGDQVIVPQGNCFDEKLVRPLPITTPGIRVYMSNLIQSARSNSGAAISGDTTSLPYGTRMLQGLFAMNCVGGTYMQSDRRAVLVSRNPRNGQSIAVERDIEELVRLADRDEANPYLMPGDSLACYDSRWTNFREALGLVGDVANTATPAILLQKTID